jgi:hypothetical protein
MFTLLFNSIFLLSITQTGASFNDIQAIVGAASRVPAALTEAPFA